MFCIMFDFVCCVVFLVYSDLMVSVSVSVSVS